MMKKVIFFFLSVILMLTTSCSDENDSSSTPEIQRTNITDESPRNTVINSQVTTSDTADSSEKTVTEYHKVPLNLPALITDVPSKQLDLPNSADISLLSIGDDYISYCEPEKVNSDERDYFVYKRSFHSGETIPLNGVMPKFNSASAEYAVCCDDAVYMVYDAIKNRHFVRVDLQDHNVEVMKKEKLNVYTDSFYFTYPINHKQYAVRWFNFDENNHNIVTNHIVLVDESNKETEVFTNKRDTSKFTNHFSVANQTIYEFLYNKATNDVSVNTYDLSGRLLSQEYFAEITNQMKSSSAINIECFSAFGSNVSISFMDENTMTDTTYIYNLKEHTYMTLENVRLIPNQTPNTANGFLLQRYRYEKDGARMVDLFILNKDAASAYMIAEGLDAFSSSIITNGEKVAYTQDGMIKICDIM